MLTGQVGELSSASVESSIKRGDSTAKNIRNYSSCITYVIQKMFVFLFVLNIGKSPDDHKRVRTVYRVRTVQPIPEVFVIIYKTRMVSPAHSIIGLS